MDLAIHFPTLGRICLESRFLFAEPDHRNCRQFLERVFQAREITQVTIKSQTGSREIPRAELGFCPRTHTLKQVVDRVTASLSTGKAWLGEAHHPSGNGSNGSHCSHADGETSPPLRSNGHLPHDNGPSSPHAPADGTGVTITSVTPVRDSNG